MENTEISKQEAFQQLIDNYIENRYCMELLRFFSSHPRTRFNRPAVILSLNGNGHKSEVERALAQLIEKGVVKACVENDTHLYALSEDEPIPIKDFKLIQLEWYRRQTGLPKANSMLYNGTG